MLHKVDQWLISLLLAIASSPIPLFSQGPREKYLEVPAEVYDFGGACHYLVELGDHELVNASRKSPFFTRKYDDFCISPNAPPSLWRSANLMTIQKISGLRSKKNFCFSSDEKSTVKEVNISFFFGL